MDEMVRIDWMHHRHEDAVILLNSKVVEFTMKVVVKGRTCVLRPLISLIRVHVRGFVLVYLFYHHGKSFCPASIDL
jgi:hypothetical protein